MTVVRKPWSPHLERLARAGDIDDLAAYALHLEHLIDNALIALGKGRTAR